MAKTNGGLITAAIYNHEISGSRVLVSSSNYWLDNIGIAGGYIGAGVNNRIFAENAIDWLTLSKRVIKTGEVITSNSVIGDFVVIQNKTLSTVPPIVYLEENEWVGYQEIIPINHGNGNYSLVYSYSGEGILRVEASFGDDYIVWEVIVDTTGPVITPHDHFCTDVY